MASNMKIKKKSSEKTFDIINGAFLLILVILVAYPLYYVLRQFLIHMRFMREKHSYCLRRSHLRVTREYLKKTQLQAAI